MLCPPAPCRMVPKRPIVHLLLLFVSCQVSLFVCFHSSRSVLRKNDDEVITVNNDHLIRNHTKQSERVEHLNITDRVFPKWEKPLPCYNISSNRPNLPWHHPKNLKRPTREGLFFLKLLKTASTTGSSIHLRIAHNLAQRQNVSPICRTRHLHGWAGRRMYQFGQRDADKSFLWTLLRQPAPRYISEFFHFHAARQNMTASDANIIDFLRHGKHSDRHYLSWLTVRGYRKATSDAESTVQHILQDYNFIGVLERLDESVVALQMILGVPLADVLSVPSKLNGGYDDGEYRKTCFRILPSFVSDGVQAFLDSDEWQEYIGPEQALYNAVNRSLDRTIDALGRDVFKEHLRVYRHAMHVVEVRCRNVRFPCSEAGERRSETDCIAADMGCGFDCLDQVATELNLW